MGKWMAGGRITGGKTVESGMNKGMGKWPDDCMDGWQVKG